MEKKEIKAHISALLSKFSGLWEARKIPICITAAVAALCITVSAGTALALKKKPEDTPKAESEISLIEITESIYEPAEVSEPTEVSVEQESVASVKPESISPVSSAPTNIAVKKEQAASVAQTTVSGDYKYNSNSDIDDNIFLDALIYTGYNINKHRADGKMWQYILAANKRGLGYLSNITYAGGSSGYETSGGKPDIKYFEKHGLVCASYVTYVYFNYLPNVAGIDTSALPKPARSTSANDWYSALKQWVSRGYSRRIPFTASKTSAGFINFKASESIPIGSIIVFCDSRNRSDYGSHVAIYAGYKNNYNWLFHVGNKNGPEFCAVERMNFGHDPQWPIAVITPPESIRMSAMLEVTVTDNSGNPISGAEVSLKSSKTGAVIDLGRSNGGTLTKEGLTYGDYTLSFTVPAGYTADSTVKPLTLTTASNSKTTVNITLAKIPPAPAESPSEPSGSTDEESPQDDISDQSSSEEATANSDSPSTSQMQ